MEMRQALELISGFTADQWGMITSQQAKGLGVDDSTLHRMEKAGYLDRVRRGVYASTTAVVTAAREEQAAWLALNPAVAAWERARVDPDGGVVSHQSATRMYGIGELVNDRISFTTPRRRTSRDPDLWFKRAKLSDEDMTLLDGLPVTTAARTICDLLDQNLDGSHIGTIIREAVHANLVELDVLAARIGPYALRYNVRRPGDGEALLEHLLNQIGETIEQLTRRPAPPRSASVANLAWLATVAQPNIATTLASIPNAAIAPFLPSQQPVFTELAKIALPGLTDVSLAATLAVLGPEFRALLPDLTQASVVDAAARIAAEGAAISGRSKIGENEAHASTETPSDTAGLSRLAEEAGEEHGEGDGRQGR